MVGLLPSALLSNMPVRCYVPSPCPALSCGLSPIRSPLLRSLLLPLPPLLLLLLRRPPLLLLLKPLQPRHLLTARLRPPLRHPPHHRQRPHLPLQRR